MTKRSLSTTQKQPTANLTPLAGNVLQRQCACGNRAMGGECEQCKNSANRLQRKSLDRGDKEVPPSVHAALESSSQPLDATSRRFMESGFGHDFSHVRIHVGPQSEQSAEQINAQAYTVGSDIVFGRGNYTPKTAQGKRLLAHELAHVVQQGATMPTVTRGLAMLSSTAAEAQADQAADATMAGIAPMVGSNDGTGVGLQRKEDGTGSLTPNQSASQNSGKVASSPCIENIVGEDIPSLLQAGAVTIIEFGAEWCGPCKQNKAGLQEVCEELSKQPPPVPVRIYSIDVDAPGNEKLSQAYARDSVPHLYVYVGGSQKAHITFGLEPDMMSAMVADQIEYASTAGWWRGAKSGAKWGLLSGGGAGLAGAIAIGAGAGKLSGNAQMGGILGALGGGLLAGALIGGGIGAIVGAATDDRNTGPREQKRQRLQPKLRHGSNTDPLEREADDWAERIVCGGVKAGIGKQNSPVENHAGASQHLPSGAPGQSLDASTRTLMEGRFGRDFSDVRVHRDSEAQSVTGRMNAYAVTKDSNIYFARDGYAPETPQGSVILAHELAHVAQNHMSKPAAPEASLEAEATQVSSAVSEGRRVEILHGSDRPMLAITRGEQTLADIGIGAGSVGAVGALVGLGAAAAMPKQPFGLGALAGGLIGAGIGAIVGGLIGFFSRRTSSETTPETEALIQKFFGRYLRGGGAGPLHNARVHVVNDAELCERYRCRHPGEACDLIGWTDTGVPVQPSAGPQNQAPPIRSQADEPVCNGHQMEHATPEQPVIYYVRNNKTAGTLIHEGLHAHSDPSFAYLHNHVTEGTTEYFTRKLQDDINMPYIHGYDDQVASVEKLVGLVGEEVLARAYFSGSVPELHQAVNARLGRCALAAWAFSLTAGSDSHAEEIMQGRNQNYCNDPELLRLGVSPAKLTPTPGESGTTTQEKKAGQPAEGQP